MSGFNNIQVTFLNINFNFFQEKFLYRKRYKYKLKYSRIITCYIHSSILKMSSAFKNSTKIKLNHQIKSLNFITFLYTDKGNKIYIDFNLPTFCDFLSQFKFNSIVRCFQNILICVKQEHQNHFVEHRTWKIDHLSNQNLELNL